MNEHPPQGSDRHTSEHHESERSDRDCQSETQAPPPGTLRSKVRMLSRHLADCQSADPSPPDSSISLESLLQIASRLRMRITFEPLEPLEPLDQRDD